MVFTDRGFARAGTLIPGAGGNTRAWLILSFADFAPRLALRCLRILQERFPVHGGEEVYDEWGFERLGTSRQRVLGLLRRAMDA
ncbi:hypothetical protein [Ktedonospora formicarum]|uniref:Uncharacterized protein n=1 Tax=Ktedonospora formicarum TaxID=2778364 RepID=A0A8J3ICU9_9CHLR|nr:hypothetical protein [Ktedonospora formicarum]GHO50392.1 hypothetical protein KSX_85550 [Ktedonospora formicarum]